VRIDRKKVQIMMRPTIALAMGDPAGINPELTATFDGSGKIAKVEISYPRDFVKQQLGYSAMYR